ncbi:Bifunctional riboflavin biosynthesis protein RIBA 1, chloroplastic [Asimina triloba]
MAGALLAAMAGTGAMASTSLSSPTTDLPHPLGYKYFKELRGSCFVNPLVANKKTSNFTSIHLGKRCCLPIEGVYSVHEQSNLATSIKLKADSIALGTIEADIAPATNDSLINNDDFDLDQPSEGFSSIPQAIEDIRQGKFVIVVDDEDRENEGDLIMAASLVTPKAMAYIVKHGTGIVCVSMKEEDLGRLQLPLMISENEEKLCTAFTVSVDAKVGTTTGVSAKDRAKTILSLASPYSVAGDFNRPGHIFPLKYREGGVLKRAGHTEASLDLAVLAGLNPVGVLSEIVDDDDGSMARLPKLKDFAKKENLKIISIADLIRYRRKRERLVERSSVACIPTTWGPFQAYCYRSHLDGVEHVAMVKGEIGDGQNILIRVHTECIVGDIFRSATCDCGNKLALAMQQIEGAGRGVLVYLRGNEGKGIGFAHKVEAYNLQVGGHEVIEANGELPPVESREYGIGAQILRDLGIRTMKLLTNNPAEYTGLKGYGLSIAGKVPLALGNESDVEAEHLETESLHMKEVCSKGKHTHDLDEILDIVGEHHLPTPKYSRAIAIVPVRRIFGLVLPFVLVTFCLAPQSTYRDSEVLDGQEEASLTHSIHLSFPDIGGLSCYSAYDGYMLGE